MSNLLYTVREVFGDDDESYLKIHGKKYFNIPVYQRGYKWKEAQVVKLLDDINNFQPEGDKFYCLQNITIVTNGSSSFFNVVDGQQRLTTLVIILSYLDNKELVKGKVRFPENSIREETNRFINEVITKNPVEIESMNWVNFIEDHSNFDHQDIFYLFSAYESVSSWFVSEKVNKDIFTNKILNNVRIIVNNISGDNKEEKIFGNLNSKRVPLDGADLVRAILITRVANEEGKREADIKNIVRVNERRVRIGWELDEINNWWSRDEVAAYFKSFISIKSEDISVGNKLFKEDKYPINMLLLFYAEIKGRAKLSLEFIEERNNNALGLYKELVKLHSTLKDWFQDREIYHYLGFLFSQTNLKFNEVYTFWNSNSETRNDFIKYLKEKIRVEIDNEDFTKTILDETTNWYENEQESLVKILILQDVIWSIRKNQAFLPATAFVKDGHDIEHIFPKKPKEVKDKKAYIQFLNKYILDKPNRKLENDFDEQHEDSDFKNKVEDFINKYTLQIRINSIGNLVLLDSSKNRSIGNNPYSIKRAALVDDINRGTYMRPHTLKVFVRYFDTGKNGNHDKLHWTNDDIESNSNAIVKSLATFFNT